MAHLRLRKGSPDHNKSISEKTKKVYTKGGELDLASRIFIGCVGQAGDLQEQNRFMLGYGFYIVIISFFTSI
ncbi:hypothetical protein K1719_020457 [Acacia pycnantha]|nr:hypothetical protein K1719_020457 [Acacia pycnantha]